MIQEELRKVHKKFRSSGPSMKLSTVCGRGWNAQSCRRNDVDQLHISHDAPWLGPNIRVLRLRLWISSKWPWIKVYCVCTKGLMLWGKVKHFDQVHSKTPIPSVTYYILIAFDEREKHFDFDTLGHCLVRVCLLHCLRVGLRNGYTQAHAQTKQHAHMHKAVDMRVKAKILLSHQRQSDYRHCDYTGTGQWQCNHCWHSLAAQQLFEFAVTMLPAEQQWLHHHCPVFV